MKSLKSSMRENKRYFLIKGGGNVRENVEKAILEFSGVLGMAEAGLKWIKDDKKKKEIIFSVNRESVNKVRASLCVYSEKIIVERISGTLNGLRKK